jgi:hypothetical protein
MALNQAGCDYFQTFDLGRVRDTALNLVEMD